jgi:hypothetical protein
MVGDLLVIDTNQDEKRHFSERLPVGRVRKELLRMYA